MDSPGSDLIIQRLEAGDPRPLWVSVWGGANTLAQALYRLRATRSEPELQRLLGKLRVYAISDQDDSGPWIRREFPQVFYIVSPGGYAAATWAGIMHVDPAFGHSEVSNGWLAAHIQQGHGPSARPIPTWLTAWRGTRPRTFR